LSWDREPFKRVGLHYIDFSESSIADKDTCLIARFENRPIILAVTNFGYHHRVNKVVTRSMAEFCCVLDTLLAVVITVAALRS
jgi:hypothetical protein